MKGFLVRYLSDVNLRAVLIVLIQRAGGSIDINNADLYDAMLHGEGGDDGFLVTETASGLRLSIGSGRAADKPS
jgi:hypothetical protein